MERVNFPALSALFGLLRLTNAVLGDGRKTACDRVEGIAVTQLLLTKALFEQPSYRGHIGGASRHEDRVDGHIGAFEGDVDRGADPLDVGRNPGLEISAGHVGADVQVARLEMKSRSFRRRELQLGFGYGLVKLVAQIRFDQMNEILDLLRSLGVPHELTQFAEGAGVFEKREPVPLREGRVIVRLQRQEFAKGPITGALAEPRRNQIVNDAKIEGVAGDADPGVRQRLGLQPRAALVEAHNREVARAAAEIGHEHGFLSPDRAGVPVGGAERLLRELDMPHAGPSVRVRQPFDGQGFVWPLSRENHGTAANDREIADAGGKNILEKDANQLLEQKTPADQIDVL